MMLLALVVTLLLFRSSLATSDEIRFRSNIRLFVTASIAALISSFSFRTSTEDVFVEVMMLGLPMFALSGFHTIWTGTGDPPLRWFRFIR